jgi:hypothetical protein
MCLHVHVYAYTYIHLRCRAEEKMCEVGEEAKSMKAQADILSRREKSM